MLSLNSPIVKNDIHTVKIYKGGKVYLIQGNGDDLVVKQEVGIMSTSDKKAFDLSKKAMGSVDNTVKSSKKLTETEIQALVQWVTYQKTLVQFQFRDQIPAAAADLDKAIANLKDASQRDLWFKMPSLEMRGLEAALAAQIGKDKASKDVEQNSAPLREFIKILKGPNGLEKLGQVIAADLFNGNSDRIVPSSSCKLTFGDRQYSFRTIQNIGNLCVIGRGKSQTITGMDFADPQSTFKAVDLGLDDQRSGYGTATDHRGTSFTLNIDWITDAGKRKTFAKDVIADLEEIFSTGKKTSWRDKLPGDKSSLGSSAYKRLEKGMVDGAHVVARYILERVQKGKKYPASFTERAQLYLAVK